jgi:N6-L-threonylcarbamoyladenine synthase
MSNKVQSLKSNLKNPKNILAIESSCDETAAAVLVNGKIVSNIISSQIKIHAKYGGIIPEVAARSHVTAIIPIIDSALKTAKISLDKIDCIAVTQGPGLLPALLVGIDTAKALSLALKIPLLPINHMEAHIYANFIRVGQKSKVKSEKITNSKHTLNFKLQAPRFPALILIVSGGHTMIVKMSGHGSYKILGETIDDAAGEAFDKTAKMMGLPYPGGPHLSKLAQQGHGDTFDFPRPLLHSKDLNFSFSGLKTSVLYTILKLPKINHRTLTDLAASTEQAIVDVLIAKMDKAITQEKPRTIMLGGGVAANKPLRKRFQILATKFQIPALIPPLEYCTDNAGMIGLAAFWRLKSHKAKFSTSFDAKPNMDLK